MRELLFPWTIGNIDMADQPKALKQTTGPLAGAMERNLPHGYLAKYSRADPRPDPSYSDAAMVRPGATALIPNGTEVSMTMRVTTDRKRTLM